MIIMHEVRNAIVSSDTSLTTGSPATLLAGDTDYFMDIVELTASNNSTASAQVSLVSDGTIVRSFVIPASTTFSKTFEVALKQVTKGTPWLADMEDITGTTIVIGANHIKARN